VAKKRRGGTEPKTEVVLLPDNKFSSDVSVLVDAPSANEQIILSTFFVLYYIINK